MTKQIEIKICKASCPRKQHGHREAGAERAGRALPARTDFLAHLAQHHALGVTGRALPRARQHWGFGQSDKPDIAYRFFDHVRYLDAFIEQRGMTSAYLVAQDRARRSHFILQSAGRISCAASPSWSSSSPCRPAGLPRHRSCRRAGACRGGAGCLPQIQDAGRGRDHVLQANAFVERVLPGGIVRKLGDDEMAPYRAPFPTPESRRPVLALPRQLPIAGEPADVYEALQLPMQRWPRRPIQDYLFTGEPGALVAPEFAERFAASRSTARWFVSAWAPAFPPAPPPRGDRALGGRLDSAGIEGGAPAARGLSRALPPNDRLLRPLAGGRNDVCDVAVQPDDRARAVGHVIVRCSGRAQRYSFNGGIPAQRSIST